MASETDQAKDPMSKKLDEGECRDCKAPIYWVKMRDTDRAMPLDRGADLRVLVGADGKAETVRVYKSHFSTCPYADTFRKVKK